MVQSFCKPDNPNLQYPFHRHSMNLDEKSDHLKHYACILECATLKLMLSVVSQNVHN